MTFEELSEDYRRLQLYLLSTQSALEQIRRTSAKGNDVSGQIDRTIENCETWNKQAQATIKLLLKARDEERNEDTK